MKRTTLMTTLAAITLVSWGLGATAGNWPDLPAKKAEAGTAKLAVADTRAVGEPITSPDGAWEYMGGDSMWSLKQHKYELRAGRVAHTADCTLAYAAPTRSQPAPAGRTRDEYPGG